MNNLKTVLPMLLLCLNVFTSKADSYVPVSGSNSTLRAVEVYLVAHGVEPSKQRTWTAQGDEDYSEMLTMAGVYKGKPYFFFVGLSVDQSALDKGHKAALAQGIRSAVHGPFQLFFSDGRSDGMVVGQETIKMDKETQDALIEIFKSVPLSPQKTK